MAFTLHYAENTVNPILFDLQRIVSASCRRDGTGPGGGQVERHERLKLARRRAGFRSAADAARRLAFPTAPIAGTRAACGASSRMSCPSMPRPSGSPCRGSLSARAGPGSAFETVPLVGLAGEYGNGGVRFFKPRDGYPARPAASDGQHRPHGGALRLRRAAARHRAERIHRLFRPGADRPAALLQGRAVHLRPRRRHVGDQARLIGRRGNDRLCDLESFVDRPCGTWN